MTGRAEQKGRTRARIVSAAGRSLRLRGIAASTVADVMKSAGLTVGGFYAHFRSKEALLAQAIKTTGGDMWRRLADETAHLPPVRRARGAVDAYLSEAHRDDPATGCVLPGTVTEAASAGAPYRALLGRNIDGFASELGKLLGEGPRARSRALALIALMYGGISLARAAPGPLSREILAAARAAGAELIGPGA